MVERDPTLCEFLNGDVGILCGWPNFENKSCVSFCLLHLLSAAFILFFVFLSSLPRISFVPLFELVFNLLLLSLLLE
jgi:hypothetical protein